MHNALAQSARRAVESWVFLVCRWPKAVAALSFALTAACAVYFAQNLRINTDTTDMLNRDLPFRQISNAVSKAFPQFSDNILVVIEGDTPDLADQAALALTARLKERPDLFGKVQDQAGDPFFRRNGMLYLSLEDLADLGDQLARAQPFLGALWRDPSLRGLGEMLDLAVVDILKNPSAAAFEIGPALDAVADVIEAQAQGRFKQLSWQDIMSGKPSPARDRRRFLLIQPALDHASLGPAGRAMAELKRIAAAADLTPAFGVQVRLTGSAALNHEELKAVESSVGIASFLSLAVVGVIVFGGLHSLRMGAAVIATLVMGVIWTAAIGLAIFGEFNLLSVAFVILFVGLSVDFGIHFCLRFVERISHGEDGTMALQKAAGDVGNALMLCTLAAAAGFFAFAPTDYRGLAQLGVIAGIGMFVALVSNFTVVPALIRIMGTRAVLSRHGALVLRTHGSTLRFWSGALRRQKGFSLAVAAVFAAGSLAAWNMDFDFDPFNLKDPKAESVVTLRQLMDDGQAGRYAATVLAKTLAEADATAGRLKGTPEVDETRTLSSFIPKLQDEKLAIIAEMVLFLAPSLAAEARTDRPAAADLARMYGALADKLDRLARAGESESARAAGRMAGLIRANLTDGSRAADAARWADLDRRLLGALPGRIEVLKQALSAGPVTVQDLPREIRDQYLAADGRARLEIVPRDDLRDQDALIAFVEAVRAQVPEVTGSPVNLYESGLTIIRAFAEASAIALFAIVLILYAVLRRAIDVLLALVPTLLAAVLTGAFSVLSGVTLNYANVIVVPLLLGVGIAYGIHLVLRGRETDDLARALATSTPRAMILSAATTVASFGSIAFATHWGMASLGILLTVSTTLTLASSLLALPPLMGLVRHFTESRTLKETQR